MARVALIAVTCLAVSAGAAASGVATPAGAGKRPSAPRIIGPRHTTDRTPTFRFVSREVGFHARSFRFRCAIDSKRLHACRRRYTPTLQPGTHTLHVRAIDPRGRTSPVSVARVFVARPIPRADQTIRVGSAPYNVAAGFGAVWVTVDGAVVRLDATTGAVVARIAVGGRPWGVTTGEGAVWVGNFTNGTVARVDPVTNSVTWRVTLTTGLGEASPVGVAAGDGSVWAANKGGDEIWRLAPATGAVLGVAHVGDAHEFVAVGEGAVWVSSEDGTVGRLDPATGAVTKVISVGSDADFIGFSPGAVWVTNYRTDSLWRLDPATGTVAAKLSIGNTGAQGVAFDGTALWVAMYHSGQAWCVNPSTGHLLRRVVVGGEPRGLVFAAGSVWVANSVSGTVSRIRVQ